MSSQTVRATVLGVLFFTCKKESNPRIIDPYSEIRNWIHINGGSYKNEVISVEYNRATIVGQLDWTHIKEIAYMDDGYIYVPFTFSLHGKETEILPAIHSSSVPGAPVKDSLYSIICNDSSTFIAVHKNDTTLARQIILNKTIPFHQSQVITAGHKQICLYNLTNGSPFAAYATTGNNSGLIIIDNNRIDILDKFQKAN